MRWASDPETAKPPRARRRLQKQGATLAFSDVSYASRVQTTSRAGPSRRGLGELRPRRALAPGSSKPVHNRFPADVSEDPELRAAETVGHKSRFACLQLLRKRLL